MSQDSRFFVFGAINLTSLFIFYMSPLSIIASLLRPLLYPFSLLYGIIIWMRNKLYDAGFMSSVSFSVPVICVGNLSTGGTGKTPHIEYLIRMLQYRYQVSTMSRGYKRLTKGFRVADDATDATHIGDEPMQFHKKFPDVVVSVCEDRMTGIPSLLARRPDIDVVLLDDAYQHRSVKPGLNILITDYSKPFYTDYILPFGGLRESRKASSRADVIIVSKCPLNISETAKNEFVKNINPLPHQQVFFTGINYSQPVDFFTGLPVAIAPTANIVLACGIAKPEPLVAYLKQQAANVHLLRYPDHHYFSRNNLEEIRQTFQGWDAADKMIVTTEKDAVRLAIHAETLREWNIPIVVVPVAVTFLGNEAAFATIVEEYIEREKAESQL